MNLSVPGWFVSVLISIAIFASILMITGVGYPKEEIKVNAKSYLEENLNWQGCEPFYYVNPWYTIHIECCNITHSVQNCDIYKLVEWQHGDYTFKKIDKGDLFD